MNWKNIGKILGISLGLTILTLGSLMLWGLAKLPSAFELKESLTPAALQEMPPTSPRPTSSPPAEGNIPLPKKMVTEKPSPSSSENALRLQTLQVLTEDFMDPRRPLVDTCRIMERAPSSEFLKDARHASARYFFSHLAEENRDPLSETAAPVFREIFRTPGMRQVLETILQSEEHRDPSLLKKAEFYYQIYKAGSELKENVEDINRVLQQSYNLHVLMKAVAKKPELAKDPRVISFCEDLQKDLNTSALIDADAAAQEMVGLLETHGVKPAELNYDPQYRSHIDLSLANTQIQLNDSWVAQIFAADIEKALKKKRQ